MTLFCEGFLVGLGATLGYLTIMCPITVCCMPYKGKSA